MERTAANDVAASGLPSTSGAHWANRDNDATHRQPGGRSAPFRRPPAQNSFPDDDGETLSPSAYLPDDGSDGTATRWFTGQETEPSGTWPQGLGPADASPNGAERAAPDYGPAPPSSPGRISFGVTAGPISPIHAQSSAAPTSPAVGRGPRPRQEERPADEGRPSRGNRPGREGRPSRREQQAAEREQQAREDESGIGQITGPGREIRPHRASRRDATAASAAATAAATAAQDRDGDPREHTPPRGMQQVQAEAPPRRSRALVVATVALAVVVLLGGGIAGMAFFSGDDQSIRSVLKLTAGGNTKGRTVTAPLGGRKTAAFELVAATTKVNVRTADLGGDLFKITAADDSGVLPSPLISKDRVRLQLTRDGDGTSGDMDVVLSSKVRWSLRFAGSADEQIVDLTAGQVAGIDVVGGSRRFELSLPKASGTVPVLVTGAVEDFSIQSPADSPVRVKVDSGAKTVAAGDVTLRDVKPGSTLTPKDWKVANRYDVHAAARLTLLSVEIAG